VGRGAHGGRPAGGTQTMRVGHQASIQEEPCFPVA
jgi:hypothetical protein